VDHPHPRREFGLVPPEVADRTSRFEFLQGLLDASHPTPPFSEVAEVWPISAEVERVVFEASPLGPLLPSHGANRGRSLGAAPLAYGHAMSHTVRDQRRDPRSA
jgi:hypothetical protein